MVYRSACFLGFVVVLSGCNLLKKNAPADAAPEAEAAPVVEAGAPADAAPAADEAGAAASELDAGAGGTTAVKKAASIPFAAGDAWSGTYECGKANTGTLKITKVNGNAVGGIFDFKTKSGKAGSYQVAGNFDPASKRLNLAAGNWIVEPKGVVTVGFDGAVDQKTYSGKVNGPGCTTFAFRKP